MEDASYSQYQNDQGRRWSWLPSWFPGNTTNTPAFPTGYRMNLEVNGQSLAW